MGGGAIFLYLWLLDKMTSISEEGVGKVLGGKPITYKEVEPDLGIPERTYQRWVAVLRNSGYIDTVQAPYGIIFTVHKAVKRFGNKGAAKSGGASNTQPRHKRQTPPPNMAAPPATNGRPNKDNTVDNTVDNTNKPPAFGQEDINLTEMLFKKIQRNFDELGTKRTRKPPNDKDRAEMNRLHRLDGYSYDQIRAVINWCQNDSFWKLNILSVTTLRRQFEKLLLKSQAGRFKPPPPSEKDRPGWRPDRPAGQGSMASIGAIMKRA